MTNAFKLKVFLLKDPIKKSNQLTFTKIELKCQERRKLIIFIKIVSTVSTLEASSEKNSYFRPCLLLSTGARLVLDCPQIRRRILIYLSTNFFTLGAVY